jgi:predicted nucleic acid-binding protein
MILVDTSVWIEHFRFGNTTLSTALNDSLVATHPFVVGELACGQLKNRARVLSDLAALPEVQTAEHAEVLRLVDDRRLWGKGIGMIDAHLLASALLSGCRLWTLDRRLDGIATTLGLAARGRDSLERP